MSIEHRLTELGMTLPSPPNPVATYVPSVQVGDLLFISGMVPSRDGRVVFRGKVGREISKERAYEAAKLALLNALATIQSAASSLDRVQRIVRMTGYVASGEGFTEQPFVHQRSIGPSRGTLRRGRTPRSSGRGRGGIADGRPR